MKNSQHHKWQEFFKAIHDDHRQRILELLKNNKKLNAKQIVEKLNLSQPTISHHLSILSDANIILAERDGKNVYYMLNKDNIRTCCGDFMSHYCHKRKKRWWFF